MKSCTLLNNFFSYSKALIVLLLIGITEKSAGQNCPANIPVTITANPGTYFPGLDNILNPGATSITLGVAGSGTTPIGTGDLLLIIQMQGAQINSTNTTGYGDGVSGGASNGYLSNGEMLAGTMEYIVATNNVSLSGGTLTLLNGTVHTYKNSAFGADGQYRYQIIRVGVYFNLILGAPIAAPSWNGSTGGVIAISITNNLNFNGQSVTASGKGFRGGGGRQLAGGAGGFNTDIVTA